VNDDTRDRFAAAIGLYNRGEYLACQETLEQIHAETAAAEQPLVRALLLLACGMHLHFNRGGGRGTLNLLRQSLVALDDFRPRRLGVEVDDLFEALQAYVEDLQERNKSGARFLDRWLAPRIKYREG
jgi:predicted metal-dependent hydrolase